MIKSINETLQPLEKLLNKSLDNKQFNLFLKVFLVLYASLAAPKLPKQILDILNHTISKIIVVFIIIYFTTKDPSLAILSSVAFIVTIQYSNKLNIFKNNKIEMMNEKETPSPREEPKREEPKPESEQPNTEAPIRETRDTPKIETRDTPKIETREDSRMAPQRENIELEIVKSRENKVNKNVESKDHHKEHHKEHHHENKMDQLCDSYVDDYCGVNNNQKEKLDHQPENMLPKINEENTFKDKHCDVHHGDYCGVSVKQAPQQQPKKETREEFMNRYPEFNLIQGYSF